MAHRLPIQWGWAIYALTYLGLGLATYWWQGCLLLAMYAAYYSLTESAEKSFVTQLVGEENKGQAFGWFHFVVGLSALPASLFFGFLYQISGPLAAFGFGAVTSLAATVMLPRPNR